MPTYLDVAKRELQLSEDATPPTINSTGRRREQEIRHLREAVTALTQHLERPKPTSFTLSNAPTNPDPLPLPPGRYVPESVVTELQDRLREVLAVQREITSLLDDVGIAHGYLPDRVQALIAKHDASGEELERVNDILDDAGAPPVATYIDTAARLYAHIRWRKDRP